VTGRDVRIWEAVSATLNDWEIVALTVALRTAGLRYRIVHETVHTPGHSRSFVYVVICTRDGFRWQIVAWPVPGFRYRFGTLSPDGTVTVDPNVAYSSAGFIRLASVWAAPAGTATW